MSDVVLTEAHGAVLLIRLNRPEVRNAIDSDVGLALVEATAALDTDDRFAAGVLTGSGPGFCAGMDLKAFLADGLPSGLQEFYERGARKPLVAAIEGFALAGGLELALTCDLIVAARDARLGIPEVSVGLFAAGGALLRLPRRVPYGVAAELALTADPITAEEAHGHGLVDRVTEPGCALEQAIELASRIARHAPLALVTTKALLRDASGRTEAEFWAHQRPRFQAVLDDADSREGPRAFFEKRPPRWTSTVLPSR